MSERSTFLPAGSASTARLRAVGMGSVCLCLLAALLGGTAGARAITVPPPAMPTFADTEVSTNIAFNADDATARVFAVNFRLSKGHGLRHFTATNEVGVAILPGLSADVQKWLYRPDWNMMRVTRTRPRRPGGVVLVRHLLALLQHQIEVMPC